MTTQAQHDALYHRGGTCVCPPDWPRDIGPSSCLPCYLKRGIDRPADQCDEHPQGVHLDTVTG